MFKIKNFVVLVVLVAILLSVSLLQAQIKKCDIYFYPKNGVEVGGACIFDCKSKETAKKVNDFWLDLDRMLQRTLKSEISYKTFEINDLFQKNIGEKERKNINVVFCNAKVFWGEFLNPSKNNILCVVWISDEGGKFQIINIKKGKYTKFCGKWGRVRVDF